ncbi:MAG: EVE domain-containing protein [Desulfovibrionales bacterium]|nr:EVE domain-containing protein [Desulfovibrionales bacterium]
MKYWLIKSEPGCFSIDDLAAAPQQTTCWDGVRNYQARNFMRDEMSPGDLVLFYHSVTDPCVVGIARVVRESYPDHTAWNPDDTHYDPRSTPQKPLWFMVDVQFVEKFSCPVPLAMLRGVKGLEKMEVLKKGSRLSVMPVTEKEFIIVSSLGNGCAGERKEDRRSQH